MKSINDLSTETSFYLLLAFLAFIPFSIAACYFFFIILALQLIFQLRNRRQWPPLAPFFPHLIVFSILTLVSTVFSIDPAASLKANRDLFIFLLVPIFSLVLNHQERIRKALTVVFISASLSALVGLFQWLRSGVTLSDRLKGFTSHWMTFSGLLMMAFLFYTVYLLDEKDRKRKIIGLLLLTPWAAAIAFSLTRSVWVGIVLALAVVFSLKKPRLLLVLVPLGVIAVLLMPQAVQQRLFSVFDPRETTNLDRLYMVHTAGKIFADYPLSGVGADNVPRVYRQYMHPDADKVNLHLHNNFLQILAERGIFALAALVFFFTAVIYHLMQKARRAPPRQKRLAWAGLAVFLGFFSAGMFEFNFGDSEILFLLLFFISLPFLNPEESDAVGKEG